MPGLTSNLLSVYSISKSGYVTLFRNDTCEIYEPQNITIVGNPLLTTKEQNGTYKLELETEPANVALKASANQSSINILHRRLAHLGKDNLDLLINKTLVDGIPDKQDIASNCIVCLKSRQTRATFPKTGAKRADEMLEIVHSDVCQISDGPSWNRYKYFVTFIDDKTRYTVIAFFEIKR